MTRARKLLPLLLLGLALGAVALLRVRVPLVSAEIPAGPNRSPTP